MARKATTVRLNETAQEGLSIISRLSGESLNRLVNEAVREFISRRVKTIEDDLESTLGDLRAYRMRDPDFAESIAKVVEVEAGMTYDPAEGTVVTNEPLSTKLRDLLDG